MIIKDLFQDDINRKINGVVKVDQDAEDVIAQELDEYVITRDLKKHFITFFNNYDDAFHEPTSDIGVWISGFFGSGKSHFLKILSYLLANKKVKGISTVERFRKKFEDDPATFMKIDSATKGQTDTILFNIDIEGSSEKDSQTAVLKVFSKMFYNYLGYYGDSLKLARLEQFIDKKGKTDEFRRVFMEKNGTPWLESRDSYIFLEDSIVETLQEVLGMSEKVARRWFDEKEGEENSIAKLVSEMKEYVDSKPDDFRLVFMADEVGQYIGGDTSLLLNLQSLVEKIGSECGGKIWVICTGQEAIDEVIKARQDEFSRIQARFKTRLSLTSASADEVIQKRILKKKPDATIELEKIYDAKSSELRNLFSFADATKDIKGYTGPEDFSRNYPFVSYQFIILQKVFAEIRKHGNSGKHLSGGERSMLSGFQEAVQKIQDKDEYTLAPFYLFYDTVHTFLDSSIRRVIERCQRAADNGDGIEQQDVNVLKLLYLIRYIDDIPANLENIVILMADSIQLDKIAVRKSVETSLDRLFSQNYIGKANGVYNFLTDEEQDIQRDIYQNTQVDTAEIVERIGRMIFEDIYTAKKHRYSQNSGYDFPFDRMVDRTNIGSINGNMKVRVLTVATPKEEKEQARFMGLKDEVDIVLDNTNYYEYLENAMKVRKYVKQHNVDQFTSSAKSIIQNHREEASKYEKLATKELEKAIVNAQVYVNGEPIKIKTESAKVVFAQALDNLVVNVYNKLGYITKNINTDEEIISVLNGDYLVNSMSGMEDNREAADEMENYIKMQSGRNLPTSMADIQSRYQAAPYGWREIDIAYVAAMLISEQKVTIKYSGEVIRTNNHKLVDMLRKKSETGKTKITERKSIDEQNKRIVKDILSEYFEVMDIPEDEDSLVLFIIEKFENQLAHYETLNKRYENHDYPDRQYVQRAIDVINRILSQSKDNIALIDKIIKEENRLFDSKENMENVEEFFKNQVDVFDKAVDMESSLKNDEIYFQEDDEATEALNQIRKIVIGKAKQSSIYREIPKLNDLMKIVRESHNKLLDAKKAETTRVITKCMAEVHQLIDEGDDLKPYLTKADNTFKTGKENLENMQSLLSLDGLINKMNRYKDDTVTEIKHAKASRVKTIPSGVKEVTPAIPKKFIKNIQRDEIFPTGELRDQADIDKYLENVRDYLMTMMKDSDGINLK